MKRIIKNILNVTQKKFRTLSERLKGLHNITVTPSESTLVDKRWSLFNDFVIQKEEARRLKNLLNSTVIPWSLKSEQGIFNFLKQFSIRSAAASLLELKAQFKKFVTSSIRNVVENVSRSRQTKIRFLSPLRYTGMTNNRKITNPKNPALITRAELCRSIINYALFILLTLSSLEGFSQAVSINPTGAKPDPSAMLDVSDTTKGFLPPRMSTNQMNAISSPAAGLLVFNTTDNLHYFYNGTAWQNLKSTQADSASVPVGTILPFGADSSKVPNGFLLCDGSSLSTALYPDLFNVIGYSWGGSGSSFNLPDLRGRFLRGTDYGAGNDPDAGSRTALNTGGNIGDEVGSAQSDELKSHNHRQIVRQAVGNPGNISVGFGTVNSGEINSAQSTASTGGNETRPINANVNYVICFSSKIAASAGSGTFQGTVSASSLPAEVLDSTRLADADGDTKIQVEESADEDIIRFDLGGTEYFRMNGPRLEVLNSGFGVFIGNEAGLNDDLGGNSNVYIGEAAGKFGTIAESNVFVGFASGENITTGTNNIAIGDNALNSGGISTGNVAVGDFTMENSTGFGNSALGAQALNNNAGDSNTAIGVWSLYSSGSQNGNNNVALGAHAGEANAGSNNVLLGYKAGSGNTFSNKLYIENSNSASPLIWGDFANDSLKLNARGVNIIAPNGQDAVLTLAADLDNNNENENPQIRFEQDGGGNRALIGLEGTNDLTVTGGGSNNLLVGTLDNEDVQFFTNNVAHTTLDTDGDFGIGTATPTEKLHVFDSAATSRGIIESSSATGNAGLRLQTAFTTFDIENKYASGRLVFENRVGDDIFSMDSTLRVGIGTGFPAYTLDARNPNGDADISARSDFAGGDAQLKLRNLITTFDITNKGSTGKLIVENHLGADLVTIDTLGRVAIGTEPSSPYHSLSVSSPNIGGIMRLNQETASLSSEIGIFVNDNFKWSVGGTDDSNTKGESFFVYNNDRGALDLFIDGDNGRTGFGTTNPFGKIHVDNSGGDVAIMTSSSDAEIGYVTGTDFEIVGVNDSTGAIEERPFIITGGRVGIGTQAPIQKLDVRGGDTDDAALITFGNSDRSHFMQLFPGRLNDPNPYIQWKSGDPLRFANDAFGFSELMRISEFGHLGIGTDNVVQQIDVLDTNATEVGIRLGADQTDQYVQLDYNVSGGFSSLQSGNYTGTTRNLVLQGGGGNVGIGTTTPIRPLDVNGNGIVRGLFDVDQELRVKTPSGGNYLVFKGTNNTAWQVTTAGTSSPVTLTFDAIGTFTTYFDGSVFINGATPVTSDSSFKTEVTPLTNVLAQLELIEGVSYFWDTLNFADRNFSQTQDIGLIAQKLQRIYPQLVIRRDDGYLAVDYAKFTAVLLQAIKEQQEIIKNQGVRLSEVEAKLNQSEKQNQIQNQRLNLLENWMESQTQKTQTNPNE